MLVGSGKSTDPIRGADMFYIFAREIIIGFHNRVVRAGRLDLVVPKDSKYGELYMFVVSRLNGQEKFDAKSTAYSQIDFDAYVAICNKLWNGA